MGSEKSDEDMELPQATERVLPFESERAKLLSVDPDAVTQPITVGEEKGLSTVQVSDSKEPVNLDDDEIEEEKPKLSKRKLKKLSKINDS
ncbi:hypothetical protein TNCV_4088981 [Trichonephila clavipes]|nr:hypothetical protein TNCV_4088981 [Trichonephila clavipes]